MKPRISIVIAVVAAFGLLPSVSGAATSVTIANATQSGSSLSISGTSTFDNAPFTAIGTDGTGDTFVPGFGAIGGDMTAAQISTTTNGDLQFRWVVTELLPAPADGSPTGVIYAWDFCVDDETCFEIDGGRNGLSAGVVGPYASLWGCATSACDPGGQTFLNDGFTAVMSAATNSFTVTLPAGTISAAPGSTISGASGWSVEGPVFTDVGDGGFFPVFDVGDGVSTVDEYTVPGKQVSLAIAAPGLDPAAVSYTKTVVPSGGGSFAAILSTSELAPGDYSVYARACLGAGNCGYGTRAVTIV